MYFKSTEGKAKILKLYNQKLLQLNIDYSEKQIATKFGNTNVIICGDTELPPLALIHGSGGCAPLILESFPSLSLKYCVYAIDVLAQPNKSDENQLDIKSLEYGEWLLEIFLKLRIKDVTLIGFSFGGLISLKTLQFNETLIKEVFLIAPVYIVNGNPLINLLKMFIPLKKFIKRGNKSDITKVLKVLFSEYDDFAMEFLATTFTNCNIDFSPLPVISGKSAQNIKTPITLIACENDIMFPGKKMIKRAKRIFPSVEKVILLEKSKHVPSSTNFKKIEKLILS
ncbi:alpha/beta hydrolase [Tenacibaculum sp. 190524A05c]|uniref:Alpha/beta hydrolase n=1 Tax=Tenacibaculum platacis TaxID=3137852 RepID=A0ABM9P396_9FLAO